MTKPAQRIDPDTLVTPLMNVTWPLPEGTPLYNSDGYLIATLGKSVPNAADGSEFFVAPLIPSTQ